MGMASEHLVLVCSYSDKVIKEELISLVMGTLIQAEFIVYIEEMARYPRGVEPH